MTATLANQIAEALAPFDARVLESKIAMIPALRAALKSAQERFAHLRGNCWAYYPELFAAVGGKGIYQLLTSGADVEATFRRDHAAATEARNAKIATKLVGVEALEPVSFAHSQDGFNGVWRFGDKVVTVNTIFAGGYNIQCAHLRVLVKVK